MSDSDNTIDDDFEFSRRTYYDLIQRGKEALDDMIEVAKSTEHPRSYEVLGTLIKQVSDVNDRLMDVNKKRAEIKSPRKTEQISAPNTNIFVGSTTDLQRFLIEQQAVESAKADNVIDITDYRADDQ